MSLEIFSLTYKILLKCLKGFCGLSLDILSASICSSWNIKCCVMWPLRMLSHFSKAAKSIPLAIILIYFIVLLLTNY